MFKVNNKRYKYNYQLGPVKIYTNQIIEHINEIDIGEDRLLDPVLLDVNGILLEAWSSEWGRIKLAETKDEVLIRHFEFKEDEI